MQLPPWALRGWGGAGRGEAARVSGDVCVFAALCFLAPCISALMEWLGSGPKWSTDEQSQGPLSFPQDIKLPKV